jgi:hypothetical protein
LSGGEFKISRIQSTEKPSYASGSDLKAYEEKLAEQEQEKEMAEY